MRGAGPHGGECCDAAGIVNRAFLLLGPLAGLTLAGVAWTADGFGPALGVLRWPLLALFAAMLAGLALHAVPPLLGLGMRALRGLGLAVRGGVEDATGCGAHDAAGRGREAGGADADGLDADRTAATDSAAGAAAAASLRGGAGACTAVLLPVCNEDAARVFAAVRAMRDSLCDAGLDAVDLHVLSDTTSAELAREEAARFALLGDHGVFYRRRVVNTGRKTGNIAEFCARCGERYAFMVVLDADSLISGATVGRLMARMAAEPGVGMIQTIPYAVNRETLFARMTQFAMRLYTPLWAEGAVLWQGAQANYWGHNAIIRIAPFLEHCGLPVLPGRAPLGGEILCHDVVEAALMQAAGWEVHLDHTLGDTFEEVPPNLIDHTARERRWCQGNLQHLRVMLWPRLRFMGRLHLGAGISFYVAGPVWVGFAVLLSLAPAAAGRRLAAEAWWPLLALVLLPRLASLAVVLASRRRSAAFGGRAAALAGVVLDQALTVLLMPLNLVVSAQFVAATLGGRSVGWGTQARCDRGVGWGEALRLLWPYLAAGTAWVAGVAALRPGQEVVLLPALAALLASPALAVWSSRTSLGRLARRGGLFRTIDEVQPSRELRQFRRAMAAEREPAAAAARRSGLGPVGFAGGLAGGEAGLAGGIAPGRQPAGSVAG